MSACSIDPKQVLDYLCELGYTDIDKDRFILFLKDLRKLIKYDEKKRIENQENIIQSSSALSYASTSSFEAKKQEPKYRPLIRIDLRTNSDENRVQKIDSILQKHQASKVNDIPKATTTEKQRSTNFIKAKRTTVVKKHDPVALYHYYQDIWKHTKIPGETDHSKLRWSIREKILGDKNSVSAQQISNSAVR